MILEQFFKSLLVILKLKEFLDPHNLCFIFQEDELDSFGYQLSDIASSKASKLLTCSNFVNDIRDLDSKVLVPLSPCKEFSQVHWTFWRNNSIILMPEMQSIASRLNINLNSRAYFLASNERLFEIFKYKLEDADFVQQEIGLISSSDFLETTTYIWDRRTDLSSISLKVIYFDNPPYTIKQNDSRVVEGYHADIFHSLQEKLNFNYSITMQEEKRHGSLQKGGLYDGILGAIQTGIANWSISEFIETDERALAFDFSIPILNQPRRFRTWRPSDDFNTSAYFEVFSQQFWICLAIFATALIFFMYWILRLGSMCDQEQSSPLVVALIFILLSLCCRESCIPSAKWSGKIIAIVVLFWGFLISVSYNAILTSALAYSQPPALIRSMDEMLHSPYYTVLFRDSSAIETYFKTANETSAEKQIFEKFERRFKKEQSRNWKDFNIPLEEFTHDVALLLNDVETNNLISAYDIDCQVITHPIKFFPLGTSSFVFQKDFPLREVINYQLQKLKQTGLLAYLSKKYLIREVKNCDSPFRELDFKATFLLFAILVIGFTLSSVFVIVEKIISKKYFFPSQFTQIAN